MRSSAAMHYEERQPRDDHHNGSQQPGVPREGNDNNKYPAYGGGGVSGGADVVGDSRYEYPYVAGNPAKLPPQSPHSSRDGGRASHGDYGRYHYPNPPPSHQFPPHSLTPRHLQSVVTSSFSLEDEREGPDGRGMGRHRMMHGQHQHRMAVERRTDLAAIERRNDSSEREDYPTSERREDSNYYPPGSSFDQTQLMHRTASTSSDFINRSFSSGSASFKSLSEPLKRSYYHHSRPSEAQAAAGPPSLPPDFMPPKRMKVKEGPRGEKLVTPRSPSDVEASGSRQGEWLGRGQTWESLEDEPHNQRGVGRNQSFPPQQHPSWSKPHPPHGYRGDDPHGLHAQVSPGRDSEYSPRSNWQSSRASSLDWGSPPPSSRPPVPQYRFWDSPEPETPPGASGPYHTRWEPMPEHDRHRPPFHHPRGESRGNLYLSDMSSPKSHLQQRDPPPYYTSEPSYDRGRMAAPSGKVQMVMDAAAIGHDTRLDSREGLLLLALPQDRVSLSETLSVVRENIEVFTATQSDVDAPAPGRKHAVAVGQVGLRCIHCRHTVKCSDRVKRAVCYPSSIKRIYRTVIDMKLDHFSQCRFVPDHLKSRLHQLKSVQTRSTGTTMQYFIRAAHALGMEDGPSGVRLREAPKGRNIVDEEMKAPEGPSSTTKASESDKPPEKSTTPMGTVIIHRTGSESTNVTMESAVSKRNDSMMSTESFDSNGSPESIVSLERYFDGCVPLALPEDKTSLSPLRCFLREQVCAFSATEDDIAVRAPTTFSISGGQVGIGCIHCLKQPPKLRSNRAVCFPFSIGRIYQSVADIQRFHFTECKMLPPEIKEKFNELQSASSKGSKGLATRTYWVTSAKKIGLVDTQRGIRFGRDPMSPEESKAFSLDILAAAAFSVTTANKQLVIEEDKDTIAEFLYVVMEQLQPCRFTEADRNKRRLKDVGCIGVECKHCAGQVDGRKFFWSSVSAVESNFVSVHTHMLECKMVPEDLKEKLAELKTLRKQQTAALKTGSQKAFFTRVWERLHDENERAEAEANKRADQSMTDAYPESACAREDAQLSSPEATTTVLPTPLEAPKMVLPTPLPPSESVMDTSTATPEHSAIAEVEEGTVIPAVKQEPETSGPITSNLSEAEEDTPMVSV